MQPKYRIKKLALQAEVIRVLTRVQIENVRGGDVPSPAPCGEPTGSAAENCRLTPAC